MLMKVLSHHRRKLTRPVDYVDFETASDQLDSPSAHNHRVVVRMRTLRRLCWKLSVQKEKTTQAWKRWPPFWLVSQSALFISHPFPPILFCKEKIRFSLPLRASVENLHCRSSWCFLFLFIFEAPSWFNTHMYLKIPTAAVLSFNTERANVTQLQ